jgi:hypothetical protein
MTANITVSKVSVDKVREKLYRISLNLTVTEDESELINQTFQEYYRSGDVPSVVVNRFYANMQAVITGFIEAQAIYDAAALDNAITYLETSLKWE